jgi:phosphatidylserine decarboxylase
MPAEPTQYWHRTKKTVETEKIYGEPWLRFTYGNPVGRLALWLLVRRAVFSHYYGWRMGRTLSANKVLPFIIDYGIDHQEFAKSPYAFRSFNEFFTRALKPEARPVVPGRDIATLPADGRHLVFPAVERADGFYVKGSTFTLAELFGEAHLPPEKQLLAGTFTGGAMLVSRLAPPDYHRFHFPVGGVPDEARLIPGWLYSVHPLALRRHLRYLV